MYNNYNIRGPVYNLTTGIQNKKVKLSTTQYSAGTSHPKFHVQSKGLDTFYGVRRAISEAVRNYNTLFPFHGNRHNAGENGPYNFGPPSLVNINTDNFPPEYYHPEAFKGTKRNIEQEQANHILANIVAPQLLSRPHSFVPIEDMHFDLKPTEHTILKSALSHPSEDNSLVGHFADLLKDAHYKYQEYRQQHPIKDLNHYDPMYARKIATLIKKHGRPLSFNRWIKDVYTTPSKPDKSPHPFHSALTGILKDVVHDE